MKLGFLVCAIVELLSIALPLHNYTVLASAPVEHAFLGQSSADSSQTVPNQTPATSSEQTLPFRLSHGYLILVEGEIGTLGHLKFILDTGATISIVNTATADKLKIARLPTKSFNFDRNLNWQQGTFPAIQFGAMKAANLNALIGKLTEYSEFADGADAVIGLDLLGSTNFTVDYVAKTIVFHAVRHDSNTNATDVAANGMLINIQIEGRPVRLLVDTGFPSLLLFEERLLANVPGIVLARTGPNVTLGGRLHARQSTINRVSIGQITSSSSALIAQSPSAEILPGISGITGIAPLHAKHVNFDFLAGSFSWD